MEHNTNFPQGHRNAIRQRITGLMDGARYKIQIAVSWLTDDILIEHMARTAGRVNLEILLSNDPLNVLRYQAIRSIQRSGGKVRKSGSTFPGTGGFMHAKVMIIDGQDVFGGSFNFTGAAGQNYENFGRYADEAGLGFRQDFERWFSGGRDYTEGFEGPEQIRQLLQEQIDLNSSLRSKLVNSFGGGAGVDERSAVLEQEMLIISKQEELRSFRSGVTGVGAAGGITTERPVATVRAHRFHGGDELKSVFGRDRMKGSYYHADQQRKELMATFSFLRCRIVNDVLIVRGGFAPGSCRQRDVRIEYRRGDAPKVYISGEIAAERADVHVYRSGALCLFFPGDMRWNDSCSISRLTIPWVVEWILNYEIFLLTGRWESPAAPHAGPCDGSPRAGASRRVQKYR